MTRYQVLSSLVKQFGWKHGAELGVYQGETFFHLLDTCPGLTMVGVDRWERTPGPKQDRETGKASYEAKPMEQFAAEVVARSEGYGTRARIIHSDTVAAAALIPDEMLDFVFVDASHDTDSVSADIKSWLPKVNIAGMVIGHDINWPSVRRAVGEAFGEWDEYPANIWAMWRSSL